MIVGFLSSLLIPVIQYTSWSITIRTTVSGLLAFGVPELFMLVAIAIMGKSGYEFLKSKFFMFLKKFAPADSVSLLRYRVGLFLFSLPVLFGWAQPYLVNNFKFFQEVPTWYYIVGDALFVISLFVLGGDFWDKLKGLFQYKAKISLHKTKG